MKIAIINLFKLLVILKFVFNAIDISRNIKFIESFVIFSDYTITGAAAIKGFIIIEIKAIEIAAYENFTITETIAIEIITVISVRGDNL